MHHGKVLPTIGMFVLASFHCFLGGIEGSVGKVMQLKNYTESRLKGEMINK